MGYHTKRILTSLLPNNIFCLILHFVLPLKYHYQPFSKYPGMHGRVSLFGNHQDFCLVTVFDRVSDIVENLEITISDLVKCKNDVTDNGCARGRVHQQK